MRSVFIFILLGIGLLSCKNNTSADGGSQIMTAKEGAKPSDEFMSFYGKFHSDSAYQMAHIAWPLQGVTDEKTDSVSVRKVLKTWEPKDWIIHHTMDYDNSTEFTRTFQVIGDVMVIEVIRAKALNFGQERRFFKNENNEWELIYYADLQEFK